MQYARTKYIAARAALLASTLIAAFGAHAQSNSPLNPSIEFYAKAYRVSYAEAERRFAKEDAIAPLRKQMQKNLPDAFAGLYIEHEPEHHAVVLFTHHPQALLARYTRDPFYVAKQAPRPLELLEAVQEEIVDQLAQSDVGFFGGIRLRTSEIEIETMDVAEASRVLSGLLTAFDFVKVKKTNALPEPLDIQGGIKLYGIDPGQPVGRESTLGFNVVDGSRELGIVSSGHTSNNITHIDDAPISLSFQGEQYTGSYDFQWHKQNASSAPYPYLPQPNEILTPSVVEITGTTAQSSMEVGQIICKYGIKTQNTCGRIDQINSPVPNGQDGSIGVFVSVSPIVPGRVLAVRGDSGSPVYRANSAFGIVSSAMIDPNNPKYGWMWFMPVERFGALGISVVTEAFAIGTIPDVSGPQNTDIPTQVNFEGYPRFPVQWTIEVVSCPSGWTCNGGVETYPDTAPPPLTTIFRCNVTTSMPTATFIWRSSLTGADGVVSDTVEHTTTCTGSGLRSLQSAGNKEGSAPIASFHR